jgi:hypothetical protein
LPIPHRPSKVEKYTRLFGSEPITATLKPQLENGLLISLPCHSFIPMKLRNALSGICLVLPHEVRQTTYHLGLKLYTRIYVLFGKGKIQLSHNWINICYTKLIFEKYFYYDFKLPKVLLLTLQAESVFLSFMYPYHKKFLKLFTRIRRMY